MKKTKTGPGRPAVEEKVRLVLSSSKDSDVFLRWYAERNNVDLSAGFNIILGCLVRGEFHALNTIVRDFNSRGQF